MKLIKKAIFKTKVEIRFYLEQKWGLKKSADPSTISKSILSKYLPSNSVILDCGAHVGVDSIELARIFKKGEVHAIEAIPDIFYQLTQRTKNYNNIHCYNFALSDTSGTAKMYVSSGKSDGSSSLLEPTGHLQNHPNVLFQKSIDVQTFTLDAWAQKYNIKKIDFLWLDMQGFELNMLKASTKTLKSVRLIHTEVSVLETYLNAPMYSEIKEWLNNQGFKVIYEAIPPNADMGNVLFLNQTNI